MLGNKYTDKDVLRMCASLSVEEAEALSEEDWDALESRMSSVDPPDSDLRACLMFAQWQWLKHREAMDDAVVNLRTLLTKV